MKKLFALFMISGLLFLADSTQAQVVTIPDNATEHFKKNYPGATEVDWNNNVTNYIVKFKKDGKTCRGHYRLDGTWDFTETYLTVEQLPATVKDALSKGKYGGWSIESVAKVVNNDKQELYRIEVKKGLEEKNVFYDINGKEVKANPKL